MKVAIAGYGVEGEQNYHYWKKLGAELTIVDAKEQPSKPLPDDAITILGPKAFNDLSEFDLVVRTAGLSPAKLSSAKKIWSATNEFFAKCPAPIIGVTGTKGKGTTSSLIASILRADNKTVHLVGNIGVPALEVLPDIQTDHIVVFELSSFQLWDIEKSPHTAVVLGIEPDHLDVHSSFEEYIEAKGNITRFQNDTDIVVYKQANEYSTHIAHASGAIKVPYPSNNFAHVKDGYFCYNEQKICSTDTLLIPGNHNIENACAAISAVWEYVQDPMIIAKGLASFEGLPHRLKFVRSVDDVMYYDDSISTTPGSAIAAINAFKEPKILLLGGSDKGAEYSELASTIMHTESVKAVICYGSNGKELHDLLKQHGLTSNLILLTEPDLHKIVFKAHEVAQPGNVVLMSPASASFDMFKNYSDRGDQFISAVESL